MKGRPADAKQALPTTHAQGDPFLVGLVLLALLSRFAWVLWVHPPGEAIFSDMARYVERALLLVDGGAHAGMRSMAWQSWGTHALLAACMKLFGDAQPWTGAALVWGSMSAAIVVMSYRLARVVFDATDLGKALGPWLSRSVGIVALLWYPQLSQSGYFLSETPYCLALLVLSEALASMWAHGRGEGRAAIAAAACVALRPQCLVFFALLVAWWLGERARRRVRAHPRAGQLAFVLFFALASLGYSAARFAHFSGYWGGIAESANMNLTAGRCHNVVTQAFHNEVDLLNSQRRRSTLDGRRVSLPGFRLLAMSGDGHALALRPAMQDETIRFVGEIGDPQAHAQLRAQCYARTGFLEQVRYSVVNLSLLWALNLQWPDVADVSAPNWQRGLSQVYMWLFLFAVAVPSFAGGVWAWRHREAAEGLALCALQLASLMIVAAVFFGTIRVRVPYDPYAFVLAAAFWGRLLLRCRAGDPPVA